MDYKKKYLKYKNKYLEAKKFLKGRSNEEKILFGGSLVSSLNLWAKYNNKNTVKKAEYKLAECDRKLAKVERKVETTPEKVKNVTDQVTAAAGELFKARAEGDQISQYATRLEEKKNLSEIPGHDFLTQSEVPADERATQLVEKEYFNKYEQLRSLWQKRFTLLTMEEVKNIDNAIAKIIEWLDELEEKHKIFKSLLDDYVAQNNTNPSPWFSSLPSLPSLSSVLGWGSGPGPGPKELWGEEVGEEVDITEKDVEPWRYHLGREAPGERVRHPSLTGEGKRLYTNINDFFKSLYNDSIKFINITLSSLIKEYMKNTIIEHQISKITENAKSLDEALRAVLTLLIAAEEAAEEYEKLKYYLNKINDYCDNEEDWDRAADGVSELINLLKNTYKEEFPELTQGMRSSTILNNCMKIILFLKNKEEMEKKTLEARLLKYYLNKINEYCDNEEDLDRAARGASELISLLQKTYDEFPKLEERGEGEAIKNNCKKIRLFLEKKIK